MRTYTHGIIGYLLYIHGSRQQKVLAVMGAIVPDIFLVLGFIFDYLGNSVIVERLHDMFHHSFLHAITETMHSFVLVIPLFILSLLFCKNCVPFFVGMLSHVIADMLTHQSWLYNHFYPLPLEPMTAVVSYTSAWFTVVEHLFILLFIIFLLRKRYANAASRRKNL